jgi:pimeloyl-ACP methyl ester carboxylesterase
MILIGATHRSTEQNRAIQRQATVESLSREGDMWGGYEQMRRIHLHGDEQIRDLRRQFNAFKDNVDDMNFSAEELGRIQAKTLIIHGDRDEYFPVELPVEIYKAVPNSALWIVPNGGHVPLIESRFPLVASEKVPFVPTALEFFAGE